MPPAGITPLVEAMYAGRSYAELINDDSKDEVDAVRSARHLGFVTHALAIHTWRTALT